MFLCNEILSKHYDTPKYVAGKCNINVTKLALSLTELSQVKIYKRDLT